MPWTHLSEDLADLFGEQGASTHETMRHYVEDRNRYQAAYLRERRKDPLFRHKENQKRKERHHASKHKPKPPLTPWQRERLLKKGRDYYHNVLKPRLQSDSVYRQKVATRKKVYYETVTKPKWKTDPAYRARRLAVARATYQTVTKPKREQDPVAREKHRTYHREYYHRVMKKNRSRS